jgi:hypothetical protein
MTDRRLRKLYRVAQRAAHSEAKRAQTAWVLLGDALDQIIEECDSRQAGLIDWAIDNGFPEFETVLHYGSTPVT